MTKILKGFLIRIKLHFSWKCDTAQSAQEQKCHSLQASIWSSGIRLTLRGRWMMAVAPVAYPHSPATHISTQRPAATDRVRERSKILLHARSEQASISEECACVCFIKRRGLSLIIFTPPAPLFFPTAHSTPAHLSKNNAIWMNIMLRTKICIQQKCLCAQISQRFLPGLFTLGTK